MNVSEWVDTIKAGVALLGAAIVFVAFMVPLLKTFIPLYKIKGRRPHFEMWNRLGLRLMIVVLLLHEAVFPLERLLGLEWDLILLRATVIPVIASIVFLLIHSWYSHPDGIKGL